MVHQQAPHQFSVAVVLLGARLEMIREVVIASARSRSTSNPPAEPPITTMSWLCEFEFMMRSSTGSNDATLPLRSASAVRRHLLDETVELCRWLRWGRADHHLE